MPDILHRIEIKAPAKVVFDALTQERGLAGWWTRNVNASPKEGATNHFGFDDKGFNDMRVVGLETDRRVEWRCIDGAPEWIGTRLTFDLKPKSGSTVLLFAQRGWREQVEFMHYCSTKWATYLLSLKSLCESGVGMPYPDDVDIG